MRVLIIDDSKEFMALLRRFLSKKIPAVEVSEYDFDQQGKPGPSFDWSMYHVLLLDYQLGIHGNGLDWLKEFGPQPGFPPTILLTAAGDEYIAAKAMKFGAADYINKKHLSADRLAEAIRDAVGERVAAGGTAVTAPDDNRTILRRSPKTGPDDVAAGKQGVAYKFVRLIGQGGMSRVYLAERDTDRRTLVLKVIDARHVGDPEILKRFILEAEMIAGLNSPYVVHIFEQGMSETYAFIAMEFFARGDLKQRIDLGLAPEHAALYLGHIALGLEAIHEVGIVHRDIKPGNIMFRSDDSLALADFGISKRLGVESDLTQVGQVLGTPNYMSPEQGRGRVIDHRADLYGAGVIFYEMLTGKKPFKANSAAELIYQHINADVPRLPHDMSHYQPILERLLAKDPEFRYRSSKELLDALAAIPGFSMG